MSGDRVAGLVWLVGLGVLLGYDLIAVIARSPRIPTLTHVAVEHFPAWIVLPFFGWLFIHFLERYSQR